MTPALNRQTFRFPADVERDVQVLLESWRKAGNVQRLWERNASIWTGTDEANWLGWLDIAEEQQRNVKQFEVLAREVQNGGFTHILLIGMGGSSLGVDVLAKTFGPQPGFPELIVLDSTDPAQIAQAQHAIDVTRALFIVSSKSGTTLEPNILMDYFFARAEAVLGRGQAGAHFIAITDPGSRLAAFAAEARFGHSYAGKSNIGGRYSVLSHFGMVPAAAMGLDSARILASAQTMVRHCGHDVPPADNPGVALGTALGTLAMKGRDKITIIASAGIASVGAWLEQLIAESTGKNGKGLIPVDGEPLGAPEAYGPDRLFVHLKLDGEGEPKQDLAIAALERSGQPVIRICLSDTYQIAQEFFRWEIATAVAGAIIGVNPFDQPDVEASKVKTRELMAAFERDGSLPAQTSLFEENGIAVFAGALDANVLTQSDQGLPLASILKSHLGLLQENDYCALLAYVADNERNRAVLQDIRVLIRDAKRVATAVQFGPRFLHSTGQAYKGGPNSGVFLQITAEPTLHLAVPHHRYDFGAVIAAQARGDFAVLSERGRRVLRVHLGSDVDTGLARLKEAVQLALA